MRNSEAISRLEDSLWMFVRHQPSVSNFFFWMNIEVSDGRNDESRRPSSVTTVFFTKSHKAAILKITGEDR